MENLSGRILSIMLIVMSLVLYFTNTYPDGELSEAFSSAAALSFVIFLTLTVQNFAIKRMEA